MRRFPIALAATLVVTACSEPTAPLVDIDVPTPALAVLDGSSGGVQGFFFAPPVVPERAHPTGPFDNGLEGLLSFEICEWTNDACVLPLVRTFGPPMHMAEEVELDGAYWDTGPDHLDPEKDYRIRVLLAGSELGWADVDVLASAQEAWHYDRPGFMPVVRGTTVLVPFRVEEGLAEPVGPGGGTVTLAGGDLVIDIPAGAVADDLVITAVPTTELPPDGPPVVPGTAWDFGPDGLVFDEPVTLTLSYDPADLPPDTDESELRIHKLVDGEFIRLFTRICG